MTTLIGIKSNYGIEGIVMAADAQVSIDNEKGMLDERGKTKKITFGEYWIMSDCGGLFRQVQRFYGFLKGHKTYNSSEDIARRTIADAIQKSRMIEVDNMNAEAMSVGYELGRLSAFLFAVRDSEDKSLRLYSIDEFGNLSESDEDSDFDYLCIGSGKKKAKESINRAIMSGEINPEKITLSDSIRIARNAIKEAERDIYTGLGIDLIVMTSETIYDHGSRVRKALDEFENTLWEAEMKKYPQ